MKTTLNIRLLTHIASLIAAVAAGMMVYAPPGPAQKLTGWIMISAGVLLAIDRLLIWKERRAS